MRIELDSALRQIGNTLTSFDARSAYLKTGEFYINVFTVIRGSRLTLEQLAKNQDVLREKWRRFAAGDFIIEFRSLACDVEGQRQMKLILAELEEREATDRLRTEDIDEFDFEAREAVGKLFQAYSRLILDSDFEWPGANDKSASFVAAHVPFRPMSSRPELRTAANLQGLSSEVRDAIAQAMDIKGGGDALKLGAYIGLPTDGL